MSPRIAGDVIVGVDSRRVRYGQDVAAALDDLAVGQMVKVQYMRGIESVRTIFITAHLAV